LQSLPDKHVFAALAIKNRPELGRLAEQDQPDPHNPAARAAEARLLSDIVQDPSQRRLNWRTITTIWQTEL